MKQSLWARNGNVWFLMPLPFVTVEPSPLGGWEAKCAGRPLEHIPRDSRSDTVRQAVYQYYDERVNL